MGAAVALLALRRGRHHWAVVTVAKTFSGEPAPATWEVEPGGIGPGRTVVLDELSESTLAFGSRRGVAASFGRVVT